MSIMDFELVYNGFRFDGKDGTIHFAKVEGDGGGQSLDTKVLSQLKDIPIFRGIPVAGTPLDYDTVDNTNDVVDLTKKFVMVKMGNGYTVYINLQNLQDRLWKDSWKPKDGEKAAPWPVDLITTLANDQKDKKTIEVFSIDGYRINPPDLYKPDLFKQYNSLLAIAYNCKLSKATFDPSYWRFPSPSNQGNPVTFWIFTKTADQRYFKLLSEVVNNLVDGPNPLWKNPPADFKFHVQVMDGEGKNQTPHLNETILWSENFLGLFEVRLNAHDHHVICDRMNVQGDFLPPNAEACNAEDTKMCGEGSAARPTYSSDTGSQGYTSTITKAKLEGAAGKRTHYATQNVLMKKSATELGASFFENMQNARAPDGFWPFEWLHRSAFRFGGLGDSDNPGTSQVRSNLVLGTSQANTLMLRIENHITEFICFGEGNLKGVLETAIVYPQNIPEAPTWFAPKLKYRFLPLNIPENALLYQDFQAGAVRDINLFSRHPTLQIEARLDHYLLKELFAQGYFG